MKVFSQLEKAQLENTTSDTASHPKGMITYRTDLNQAKVSNGTAYKLLIDEDSTQTLSNKTYASPITSGAITAAQTATPANPSSGSNKLYFKADGKLYTLDSAGNEALVGSGGGGVKNLITNGNADDSASSIFVPYADSGTRPTDGTGGSPTVTTSVTTSSPLDGTKSYLLTKPASNVQGQGWAVPFSVDPAYRAKSLKISADFIVNSGTFVAGSNGASPTDGDLIWTIYDVTNSQIIEPSNIKMFSNSSTLSDKFEAEFQSSATGSSYRLIAHVASTSALAWELKVDNITTSPQNYAYGSNLSDPISFSPALTNAGNATVAANYRKFGSHAIIEYKITIGSSLPTGTIAVAKPSNLSLDYSANTTVVDANVRGIASATGTTFVGIARWDNANQRFDFLGGNGQQFWNATVPLTWANGDEITFTVTVPVVGWTASSRMSDGYDGRQIAANVIRNSNQTINTSATDIIWDLVGNDETNSYNTSTGEYTIPSAGWYEFTSNIRIDTGGSAPGQMIFEYVFDGTGTLVGAPTDFVATKSYYFNPQIQVKLKAGVKVKLRITSATNASTLIAGQNGWYIKKLQSPQTISEGERVSLLRGSTSGQTIPSNTDTKLQFLLNEEDTHNGWSTVNHDYTVPYSGTYQVSGFVKTSEAETVSAGQIFRVRLFVDGVFNKEVSFVRYIDSEIGVGQAAHYTGDLKLNAGQKISIVILSTVACALNTGTGQNWVAIKRIK